MKTGRMWLVAGAALACIVCSTATVWSWLGAVQAAALGERIVLLTGDRLALLCEDQRGHAQRHQCER